ncbi:MAG: filamentous hemagglutinin N-terminal domain-containing protein, partial [Sulfitobacter sp.]|nr:filamentous hemagglutinin N-terminal domain-containing protein [Sulfitobacter sp.]
MRSQDIQASRNARVRKLALGLAAFLITVSPASMANPDGGVVRAGNAVISQSGSTLNINQHSERVIIDWQGFSIATGETTRFIQPSAAAAALNRVTSGNPSAIWGQLTANGKLYLINPNGIVVGPGGRIDSQSFVASSLDVSDAEFLAGGAMRFSGDSDAAVINLGHIEAAGGDVYLLAREVRNEGEIQASAAVGLAGANDVLLIPRGNERLAVRVTGTAGKITNSGSIEAARAELKAAGNNPFALAINQSGLIRAGGFRRGADGRVILTAAQGTTTVSGTIEAPGGHIDVLGDAVRVSGRIDASASGGGGDINIGGDYQGEGALKLARSTEITETAAIRADGVGDASGGRIVVWSEQSTRVDGQLSARGGTAGGDGGFIETSSRGLLTFSVPVDVSAPSGAGGTWLLDPENIDIGDSEAEAIETTLNDGGNVHVKTADDGDEDGDINVNSSITKSEGGDSSLTLTAHNDVNVNAPITNTSEEGELDVNINAGRGAGQASSENASEDSAATTEVADNRPSDPVDTVSGSETAAAPESTADAHVETGSADGDPAAVLDPGMVESRDTGAGASETTDTITESAGPTIVVGADIITGGGRIILDSSTAESGAVVVDAGLDASSARGSGGDIEILGDAITLTDSAEVDASGFSGGGSIHIGGDFQGQGDTPTAQTVSINQGASIKANATRSGDGGEVIVWSEGTTRYKGHIEAKNADGDAASQGGFVEISGKQQLDFDGTVDTNGGTLLLDPDNWEVTSGASTLPGASTIAPLTITTNLASNNVVIQTNGSDGEDGDIRISEDVFYDSIYDLSFLAHRHIEANASVQNRNDTSGDVNLVAGWDGAAGWDGTDFDATSLIAADVTTTLYGNGNGSVNIGDGTQTSGIAVGSRSGATNVFAHDLNITAGTGAGADGRFAQLGFQVTDGKALDGTDLGSAPAVEGAIRAHVVNDITAQGGTSNSYNYAQIGHVGADGSNDTTVDATTDSAITVKSGGALTLNAGGGWDSYAQIGHGGKNAIGSKDGDVTAEAVGSILLAAGSSNRAYAQIGHGGHNGDGLLGSVQSDISVTSSGGGVFVYGGTGSAAFALLGHGGMNIGANSGTSVSSADGTVTVNAAGAVEVDSGSNTNAFAMIGHGGKTFLGQKGAIFGSAIDVTGASVQVGDGSAGTSAFSMIGAGGLTSAAGGDSLINGAGDVTVTATSGAVTLAAGNNTDAFAKIGHGGSHTSDLRGALDGTVTVDAEDVVTVDGGSGTRAFAQIGLGGYKNRGKKGDSTGSEVNVAGSAVTVSAGSGTESYAQIGAGGYQSNGTGAAQRNGNGDVTVTTTTGNVELKGSTAANNAYAQIGHGGRQADGLLDGAVSVTAAGDVVLTAGAFGGNYAQIGHGGKDQNGQRGSLGTSSIFVQGDNVLLDSTGTSGPGYTMIGFGGWGNRAPDGTISGQGNVTVNALAGDISLLSDTAGTGNEGGFTMIGHGGRATAGFTGSMSGDIALTATGGSVILTAGNANLGGNENQGGTFALVGHGGTFQSGDKDGSITVVADTGVEISAGQSQFGFAQIGHGGRSDGRISGTISDSDITVTANSGDINLTGGGNYGGAFAHIGHGGWGMASDISAAVEIHALMGSIDLTGGAGTAGSANYAMIGNGGAGVVGTLQGDVTVDANGNINLNGGAGTASFAVIGNGGNGSDGSHSGNIDVTLTGDLTLTGDNTTDRYALIGHGDEPGDGDDGHTVSGDVMVRVARDATLTNAFIGHLTDVAPAVGVGYAGGNTYVGVGRDIITDGVPSQLNSARAVNGGELRIYVGTAANDKINTDTLMNGDVHGGTTAPNNRGQYAFGAGPYDPGPVGGNPVDGNFNYYTLPDLFNYVVGATEATNIIGAGGLVAGDVTLTYDLNQADFGALYDVDGGTQFIRVESDIFYDSTNDLNLLATGDAVFTASVQNYNDTGGAVNIIGGWDGTTGRPDGAGTVAFDVSSFAAEDVTTTMVFGIDTVDYQTGGVYIGDSNQLAGVAVGSRMGETNV